jgi:hypothetical protein
MPFGTRAIAARNKVTPESLIDDAEAVRVGAMESKQFNAANGAIKVKSVLSGNWVERAEIGSPGEFDAVTDDELERLLTERLALLGFALVPAISDGSIALNAGALAFQSDDE